MAVTGPSAEGLDFPVWDTRGCCSGGGPYPEGVREVAASCNSTAGSEILDQVVESVAGKDGPDWSWKSGQVGGEGQSVSSEAGRSDPTGWRRDCEVGEAVCR